MNIFTDFSLMSLSVRSQIQGTTAIHDIAGLVCAKPNLTGVMPACQFQTRPLPASAAAMYSKAQAALTGGAPCDYTGWDSSKGKTQLDLNLRRFGYTAGQNVAIAFDLDPTINTGPYEIDFGTDDPADTSPASIVTEGDSVLALTWVAGDDFSSGLYTGSDGIIRRRTILFVCPVVTGAPNYVSFNLGKLVVQKSDTDNWVADDIDPKIKNDG